MTMHQFIKEFRENPFIRAMRERDNFVTAVTVELIDWERVEEASHFAISGAMAGKTRRRCRVSDDLAWWDFENEEDAVLFTMKFGGEMVRANTRK